MSNPLTHPSCRLLALTALLCCILSQPSGAQAQAVVSVCNQADLVAKIFAARTNGGNGYVRFNCDGTIHLTNTVAFRFSVSSSNSLNNAVTIDGTGHNITFSGPTTTNFTNSSHLFSVDAGMRVEFINLRFNNGRATNGGALWIASNAAVFAQSCTFSNNLALGNNGTNGAGYAEHNSSGTGRNGGAGTAGFNAAGGAIYNLGSLSLSHCAFLTNGVFGGIGGAGGAAGNGDVRGGNGGGGGRGGTAAGGAIYNQGTLQTTNCAFYINFAVGGTGGAGGAAGTGIFGGHNGPGGTAGGAAGGAIFHARYSRGTNHNVTFAGNVAAGGDSEHGGSNNGPGKRGSAGGQSSGGAVANHGTNAFFNSTFFANAATGGLGGNGAAGTSRGGTGGGGGSAWGGGIFNGRYGTLSLMHCTIANGEATGGTNGVGGSGPLTGRNGSPGLGRGANVANSNGTFRITNSIVAYASKGTNGYGKKFVGANNIISDRSLKSFSKVFTNADPRLETLARNGGPVETMRLGDDSPAINASTNLYLSADARGVSRPHGGRADAGAYEWGIFLTAPRIVAQPVSVEAIQGNAVSFTVVAQGDPPLLYRWRKDNVLLTNAGSATYTIPRVTNSHAGSYDVEVSNNSGSVISSDAVLTVLIPATITGHPTNLSLSPGATATFAVTAEGAAPITYQWLSNAVPISGAVLSTFTLTNVQPNFAATYSVVVRNPYSIVTSSGAELEITSVPPAITVQPSNTVVLAGRTATFTTVATGTAPLDFFWHFNAVSSNSLLVPPYQSYGEPVELNISDAQPGDEGTYGVVITNYAGSVTSIFASLRVLVVAPRITQEPQDQTVATSENALFTVGVFGSAPISYQWFSNDVIIAQATNSFLSLTNVGTNAGGSFTLWVTNSAGVTNSREASLVVATNLPPVITVQPVSVFEREGEDVRFIVTVRGSQPFVYQWLFNDEEISATNNPTATNATLVLNNITTNEIGRYAVRVTNEFGTATSEPDAVLSRLGRVSVSCEGSSCTAVVENSSSEFFYTLQVRDDAADAWFGIASELGLDADLEFEFTPEPFTEDEADYRIVVTESGPIEPSIADDPEDANVVLGQDASFTVTVNGEEPLTYRWFFEGTNLLAGFEGSTLTISNAQPENVGGYHAVVYGIFGAATSTVAGLTIDLEPAAIATSPTNVTVFETQTATFSVAAIGSSRTYQWFFNGSTPVPGATSATLTLANVQPANAGSYHVVVSNYFGAEASAAATLTVLDPSAVITSQPGSVEVYSGFNATFSVTNTGLAPFGYQWYFNATNTIPGATNRVLTLTSVQLSNAGTYLVVITNVAGDIVSSPATLTVSNGAPVITSQPVDTGVYSGVNASFAVTNTTLTPNGYQWYFNATNLISGATSNVLNLISVQSSNAGTYQVAITNAGGAVTSSPATLTVTNAAPFVTSRPPDLLVPPGEEITVDFAFVGSIPMTFQWYHTPITTGIPVALTNATNAVLILPIPNLGEEAFWEGVISVAITNAFGGTISGEGLIDILGRGVGL